MKLGKFSTSLVIIFSIAGIGFLVIFGPLMDRFDSLPSEPTLPGTLAGAEILDISGQAFGLYGPQNYRWTSHADLPPHLITAVIAIEDRDFYQHPGISIRGIIRAFIANIQAGAIKQGASTLTQQLIRMHYLDGRKSYWRKMKEAILAIRLEGQFSKNQILESYLNTAFFGNHSFGIRAASVNYFGCEPNDLTLAQAALLAGVLKAPSRLAPHRYLERAIERRNLVLQAMEQQGYISNKELLEAKQTIPQVIGEKPKLSSSARFYLARASKDFYRKFGRRNLKQTKVKIHTFYDPKMSQVLAHRIREFLGSQVGLGIGSQYAFVAVDAKNGAIKAMAGSKNFWSSQYDRTKVAMRVPLELTLPFIYSYAMANVPAAKKGDFYTRLLAPNEEQLRQHMLDFGFGTLRSYMSRFGLYQSVRPEVPFLKISLEQLARAFLPFASGGKICATQTVKGVSRLGAGFQRFNANCRPLIRSETAFAASFMTQVGHVSQKNSQKSMEGLRELGIVPYIAAHSENKQSSWFVLWSAKAVLAVWHGFELGTAKYPESFSWKSLAHDLIREEFFSPKDGLIAARGQSFKLEQFGAFQISVPQVPLGKY